jgi:hypothetical protein
LVGSYLLRQVSSGKSMIAGRYNGGSHDSDASEKVAI